MFVTFLLATFVEKTPREDIATEKRSGRVVKQ